MAKLDMYSNEINDMLAKGMSQADIIREFGDNGITIARSSLSDYLKQQKQAQVDEMTTDDETLSTRFAGALAFQASAADEFIDQIVALRQNIEQQERESGERHLAVMDILGSVTHTIKDPPENGITAEHLGTAITKLDKLAERTAGAGLRWVWVKAFAYTTVFWGVVIGCWMLATV